MINLSKRGLFASAVRVGLVVAFSLSLSTIALACPAVGGRSQADPAIKIIDSNAGTVISAHARTYSRVVYVDGLVSRPTSPSMGAHVHVWGVDQRGHRVFSMTTPVEITGNPSFIRSESFVVAVKPTVFCAAARIYVTFHGQ